METHEQQVERILAERKGEKPKRKPRSNGKHPGGRPPKYDPEVHIPAVIGTSARGATVSDIAHACDISVQTYYTWCETYPEFLEAVTRAKDAADDRVVNAFFQRALGSPGVPPDTKACTVWLGNRRPHEWRETSRVEVTTPEGIEVNVNDTRTAFAGRIASLAARAAESGSDSKPE